MQTIEYNANYPRVRKGTGYHSLANVNAPGTYAQFSINSNDPADTCFPFRKTAVSLEYHKIVPALSASSISAIVRPSGDCGGVRIVGVTAESFAPAASRSIPNAEFGDATEGVGLSVDVR